MHQNNKIKLQKLTSPLLKKETKENGFAYFNSAIAT